MIFMLEAPVNRIVVISLINKMFAYSAIKIKANIPLLYSVLNPGTSSDSPSARSNGVRFVSARLVIIHITKIGNIIISIGVIMEVVIINISSDFIINKMIRRIKAIDTS